MQTPKPVQRTGIPKGKKPAKITSAKILGSPKSAKINSRENSVSTKSAKINSRENFPEKNPAKPRKLMPAEINDIKV